MNPKMLMIASDDSNIISTYKTQDQHFPRGAWHKPLQVLFRRLVHEAKCGRQSLFTKEWLNDHGKSLWNSEDKPGVMDDIIKTIGRAALGPDASLLDEVFTRQTMLASRMVMLWSNWIPVMDMVWTPANKARRLCREHVSMLSVALDKAEEMKTFI